MTAERASVTPAPVAATAVAAATPTGRRRRLWQLPTQAHELLLAMSFTPDALRREAARTLGRMHHGRCVLQGGDGDVLYSLVRDMVTRNPMSEALQKRLDERHALAVARLGRLRDAEAVQAAWARALDDDDMPASLWALLTHPLGDRLETAALYDARTWVFAHGRRSVALNDTQAQAAVREQAARQQADDLRMRLAAQQQQAAESLRRLQAEIARLNGELARCRPSARDTALPALAAGPGDVQEPRPVPAVTTGTLTTPAQPATPATPVSLRSGPPGPASRPITVHGRRVLCVGGIQHAVARYRGRIEKLGGHFEHHDGGLEDSVQALEGRLGRAELVICQAACINHEAYHRVKRHCERTGTPCVYLDRPSLSRLDRALAQAQGGPT